MDSEFDDLLAANAVFAESFDLAGFDGVAHRGVALITCMDSRIDPLRMLGLKPGDAKIFRTPAAWSSWSEQISPCPAAGIQAARGSRI